MTLRLLTEHHLEFLTLKGDCTGSSMCTLVKLSHCWKNHMSWLTWLWLLLHGRLEYIIGKRYFLWYKGGHKKPWFLNFSQKQWNKRGLGPSVAHMSMTDQWSGTICEILLEYNHHEQFCEINLNLGHFWKRASWDLFMWSYIKFGQVVQEMSFKEIYYLELWQPLCSVDSNHSSNIGRRHHEEHSCEIILNLDQWFRRKCHLKVFLIWSSGSPFVQRSVTICAILP